MNNFYTFDNINTKSTNVRVQHGDMKTSYCGIVNIILDFENNQSSVALHCRLMKHMAHDGYVSPSQPITIQYIHTLMTPIYTLQLYFLKLILLQYIFM